MYEAGRPHQVRWELPAEDEPEDLRITGAWEARALRSQRRGSCEASRWFAPAAASWTSVALGALWPWPQEATASPEARLGDGVPARGQWRLRRGAAAEGEVVKGADA